MWAAPAPATGVLTGTAAWAQKAAAAAARASSAKAGFLTGILLASLIVDGAAGSAAPPQRSYEISGCQQSHAGVSSPTKLIYIGYCAISSPHPTDLIDLIDNPDRMKPTSR